METAKATIESALKECDSHVQRVTRVLEILSSWFPINRAVMEKADEELIGHIDQLVYRFTKMQDSMGRRLLPSVYAFLENSSDPVPFFDIINRLEKLDVITSAEEWQFFRNLRNNLAHDYPESIDQTVTTLNTLVSEWDRMVRLYEKVKSAYQKRA